MTGPDKLKAVSDAIVAQGKVVAKMLEARPELGLGPVDKLHFQVDPQGKRHVWLLREGNWFWLGAWPDGVEMRADITQPKDGPPPPLVSLLAEQTPKHILKSADEPRNKDAHLSRAVSVRGDAKLMERPY